MNIKAKCKYDYETCKAVAHISTYKKYGPKKTITIRFIFVFVLMLLNFLIIAFSGGSSINLLTFGCGALLVVLELFMYFAVPKIQYKSLSKMKDLTNEYVFSDDGFTADCNSEEYKGKSEVKYSLLIKAFETKRYFFLFENKRQAFVVDKSTLENGTAEEIREKISAVIGKKYVLCKY